MTQAKPRQRIRMNIIKKLFAGRNESEAADASKPALWNYAAVKNLDEETIYTLCRIIDRVGYEIKTNWDWEWLEKGKNNYRTLLNRSLMNAAWQLLTEKDWLSLQTISDDDKKITTIAPLNGLTKLRRLVLQNNSITDLRPISTLVKLKYLNCLANQISDLSALANLPLLEELVLNTNPIKTFETLEKLDNLRELSISADQVTSLCTCKRLPPLLDLRVEGDCPIENFLSFPEMPALKVLQAPCLKNIAGIARFATVTTLKLRCGDFSGLDGLENLKGLTHLEISTSREISLMPVNRLFALRKLEINSPNVRDIAALARLPVLHEIHVGEDSQCDRTELMAIADSLTPWDQEYLAGEPSGEASLKIETVNPQTFDLYNNKEHFGIRAGECYDGMFVSERRWLLRRLEEVLAVKFKEGSDNDFHLPIVGGLRRSDTLVLCSFRAYESTREIITAVQEVLCECQNDWIIYFQSLLEEGPDAEDLPAKVKDFTVWIYPNKIVATEVDAKILRKLIEWD